MNIFELVLLGPTSIKLYKRNIVILPKTLGQSKSTELARKMPFFIAIVSKNIKEHTKSTSRTHKTGCVVTVLNDR